MPKLNTTFTKKLYKSLHSLTQTKLYNTIDKLTKKKNVKETLQTQIIHNVLTKLYNAIQNFYKPVFKKPYTTYYKTLQHYTQLYNTSQNCTQLFNSLQLLQHLTQLYIFLQFLQNFTNQNFTEIHKNTKLYNKYNFLQNYTKRYADL